VTKNAQLVWSKTGAMAGPSRRSRSKAPSVPAWTAPIPSFFPGFDPPDAHLMFYYGEEKRQSINVTGERPTSR